MPDPETPSWPSAAALLERLARGEPVAALGVRGARGAEIARIARACGYQAIWVDLEHSAMPIDAAAAICGCAFDIGLMALVRVPERDWGVVGRVLDAGALGIIAPRVETVEQAADVVAACRFPPAGRRSAIGTLPQVGYERMGAAALFDAVNRATLVQILVESPRGIDNIDAIAAVDGVDMLAIGSNDLAAELGVPGESRHPLVRKAHETALAAARRAGKPLLIGGVGDAAYMAQLIRLGAAPFLMAGIDTELLLAAGRERVQQALASLQATK